MTTFLLNESTSLDAGALTPMLSLEEQQRVRRVVITHAHFDHIATLPFFLENVFSRREPTEIIAPDPVLALLKRHLFNDALWPDFSKLPNAQKASVKFRPVAEETTFRAGGLSFLPVRVSHIVPTYGYRVTRPGGAVLFSGDTGPTRRLWEIADATRDLKAIFLEVSFSDAQEEIACASRHLTPRMLPSEIAKSRKRVPIFLYHMKPPSLVAIEKEVRALREPRLRILKGEETLVF
jgi:ribonuclease BN (tRNA processing enzyme)